MSAAPALRNLLDARIGQVRDLLAFGSEHPANEHALLAGVVDEAVHGDARPLGDEIGLELELQRRHLADELADRVASGVVLAAEIVDDAVGGEEGGCELAVVRAQGLEIAMDGFLRQHGLHFPSACNMSQMRRSMA